MEEILIVKYGEIMLKGQNRPFFIRVLKENLQRILRSAGNFSIRKGQSLLYVEPQDNADIEKAIELLKMVFGVVVFHKALKLEKDLNAIKTKSIEYFKEKLENSTSFKLETRRADKDFPHTSHEVNTELGQHIGSALSHLDVDVHHPDITIYVNIRQDAAYLYSEKLSGPGGLPVGTGGRSTVLLSGGIDSPLAAWLIARRGITMDAIHFHSFPYTSERSKYKVIELTRQLAKYSGPLKLHVFPFTAIQEAVIENCPKELVTIIMRRQMMRAAENLALKNGSQALITGESIGQVASQTLEGLTVTNSAVSMPVFRPLIGMDKEEIIEATRGIGTYNISIQPYTDCCTIFVPKHPQTKPKLGVVEKAEENVEFDKLIEEGIKEIEVIEINPAY